MAVQNISRRAGPFTGTGLVSSFPFGFKVFLRSDVQVLRALSDDIDSPEEILRLDDDYAVTLNADQDENPGGTVTLPSPLAAGLRLAILSDIEPDQQVVLTNHDGFLPETLNGVHDKAIALIQELKEETARTLKVPATSDKTPEELTQELLSAQKEARVQAEAAAKSAEAAKESEEKTGEYAEAAMVILPYKDVIATVAGNIESVNTVKENLDDILVVSGSIDNLNAVAEHLPHLHDLWTNFPTIEQVWTDRESIIMVAGSITNVNDVASHLEHLHELWEHLPHVHQVWEDLPSIDTVAGISQNVIEVSLIGPQIGNVSDHTDSIAKVSTCMEEVLAVADDMIVEYENPDDIDYGSVISYERDPDEDYSTVDDTIDLTDVDYGNVGDALTPAVIVKGGHIVTVGQNIEAVIKVAGYLDTGAIDKAAESIPTVNAALEAVETAKTGAVNAASSASDSASSASTSATTATSAASSASASATAASQSASQAYSSKTAAESAAKAAAQSAADAAEASAKAGFSYRYCAGLTASATTAIANVIPPDNVKVGDHVLNAEGQLFRVESVTATAFTVGAVVLSLKGPTGEAGKGLEFSDAFATEEELLAAYPVGTVSGQAVMVGEQVYVWSGTSNAWIPTGELTVSIDGVDIKWEDVKNKPTFATVATSGAYGDLTGRPKLGTLAGKDTVQMSEVVGLVDRLDGDEDYGHVSDLTN